MPIISLEIVKIVSTQKCTRADGLVTLKSYSSEVSHMDESPNKEKKTERYKNVQSKPLSYLKKFGCLLLVVNDTNTDKSYILIKFSWRVEHNQMTEETDYIHVH